MADGEEVRRGDRATRKREVYANMARRRLECNNLEEGFYQQMSQTLEGSASSLAIIQNCFRTELTESGSSRACRDTAILPEVEKLQTFRSTYQKLSRDLAEKWISEQVPRDYYERCFLNSGGEVEQLRNARILKIQLEDRTLCSNLEPAWNTYLSFNLLEHAREGALGSGLFTDEELDAFVEYHGSALRRVLPDSVVYTLEVSDTDLKRGLQHGYNRLANAASRFSERVNEWEPANYHKLFLFENQWNQWTSEQPDVSEETAQACFRRPCTQVNDARCFSQITGLVREMLPIVPFIDAMVGHQDLLAAQQAGVITPQEATAERVRLTLMAAGGTSGLGGLSAIAARRIAAAGNRVFSRSLPTASRETLAAVQRSGRSELSRDEAGQLSSRLAASDELSEVHTAIEQRLANLAEGTPEFRESAGELLTRVNRAIAADPDAADSPTLAFMNQRLATLEQMTPGTPEFEYVSNQISSAAQAMSEIAASRGDNTAARFNNWMEARRFTAAVRERLRSRMNCFTNSSRASLREFDQKQVVEVAKNCVRGAPRFFQSWVNDLTGWVLPRAFAQAQFGPEIEFSNRFSRVTGRCTAAMIASGAPALGALSVLQTTETSEQVETGLFIAMGASLAVANGCMAMNFLDVGQNPVNLERIRASYREAAARGEVTLTRTRSGSLGAPALRVEYSDGRQITYAIDPGTLEVNMTPNTAAGYTSATDFY